MDDAVDSAPSLGRFIASDRRRAVSQGTWLPDDAHGHVLFADIGGFTPFAEALDEALGSEQGAEEVASTIHAIFDALADAVDRHHGSIVAVAGDAVTCWFDQEHGPHAVACALEMQEEMDRVAGASPGGVDGPRLRLKVAVAEGDVRRVVLGDPETQMFDLLVGAPVDRAGEGEKLCLPGEVLVDEVLAASLPDLLVLDEVRGGFRRVQGLSFEVPPDPWVRIAELDEEAVRPWVNPAVRERLQTGRSELLSEFRPVVVMFVAFADGDRTVDPVEQLGRDIAEVQDAVDHRGGSVFDVSLGDKGSYLLAVFGAPTAHGDDARRAAAAADRVRSRLGDRVRIGLHTGRVFAGLYAGRRRSAYTVVGDVVNTGSRLMTSAAPGQVLMSARLGSMLDRRFVVEALDPIAVKGHAAPVAVCHLVGRAAQAGTLSEPRQTMVLVGREREQAAIASALAAAKDGHGGVLGLRADAGLGKSRLLGSALMLALDEGFATFVGECQSQDSSTAYAAWQPIWNAMLGLPVDGDDDRRREALMGMLSQAAPDALPLAPLLTPVLGLPLDDNDVTRGMPAPVRKQVLEQLLTGMLRGRASMGPVCIVVDDLHWIDSLSRDLVDALSRAIGDVPVLLVLAYRPADDGTPVVVVPPDRELDLSELTEQDSAALARLQLASVSGEDPSDELVETVVARAGGNPFYLEELAREIHERGGSTDDLPASLEQLILERMDRLPASQQNTAKMASVIGRRFESRLLQEAFGRTIDGRDVGADLLGLDVSGLTVPDSPPPDEAHLFRHVLVRDVAYQTLSFRVRGDLHEQLADYLERVMTPPPVDLLAYHYAHSPNASKESLYRTRAAELAVRNGAYGDALAHVRRAMEIVDALPAGQDHDEQLLELTLLLGSIQLVTDGQGSATAKATYDRARELSRSVPPGPAVGRAVFGLWTYYLFQGMMHPAAELADEATALTAMSPDVGVRIMAHLAMSQTHMWTGDWSRSLEHYDDVMRLYDPKDHQAYVTQYAQNPRFTAGNSAFWGLFMTGFPERADAVSEECIAEARELGHEFTYTIAFLGRPLVALFRRDGERLRGSVDEYIGTATRSGNPFYTALAHSLAAISEVRSGEAVPGLSLLEEQYAKMQALGSKLVDPLMVSLLAEANLAAGRLDEGLQVLEDNVPVFERNGQVSLLPDLHRLRGELLLVRGGSADESLHWMEQGRAIAARDGALSLELRSALAAARLHAAHGRGDDARALLEPIVARFTEGGQDADLVEARRYMS